VSAGGVVRTSRSLREGRLHRNRVEQLRNADEVRLRHIEAKKAYDAQLEVVLRLKKGLRDCPGIPEKERRKIRNTLEEQEERLDAIEANKDRLRTELERVGPIAEKIREGLQNDEAELLAAAHLRELNEKKVTKRFVKERKEELDAAIEISQAQSEDDALKTKAGEMERKKAKKGAAKARRKQIDKLQAFNQRFQESHEARARSILSLKTSTQEVHDELAWKIEHQSKSEAKRLLREKEEFNRLLESGSNPYEVFRRRRQDSRVAKITREIEQKLKRSEMSLAERMIQFDEYNKAKDAEEAREAAMIEVFNKSLGRDLHEQRISEYLKTRTKGSMDTIDPSGRQFRVEPSSVTIIKPSGFGLGKVQRERPDIVNKVAGDFHLDELILKNMLIPRKARDFVPHIGEVLRGTVETANRKARDDLMRQRSSSTTLSADDEQNLVAHALKQDEVVALGTPPGAETAVQESLLSPNARLEDERGFHRPFDEGHALLGSSNSERTQKRFQQKELSQFQKNALHRARQRQLEGIVREQVVLGRSFQGQSFQPKPSSIQFCDFEVGKTYEKVFVLTNVSYSFASFKLLHLPRDLRNFFEICFEKPGRMSAGLSCKILITFTPKVNSDIFFGIPFLSSTGRFDVPVHCTTKKLKPVLMQPQLDFGCVVHGESKTLRFKIRNHGALESPIEVSIRRKDVPESGDCDLTITPVKTILESYGSTPFDVSFRPKSGSDSCQVFDLRFAFEDSQELLCSVLASTTEVSLHLETSFLDFKTCVRNKLYRSTLKLKNRGAVSLRMKIEIPQQLQHVVEFLPDVGFVQGRSEKSSRDGEFDIQVKFRPDDEVKELCEKLGFMDDENKRLSLPFQIVAPDQTLPVAFRILAGLTSSNIEFNPSMLNFGSCYVQSGCKLDLKISNHSELPQRFGFVNLKAEIMIAPNDGFGTILPNETQILSVRFLPGSALDYNFELLCKTDLNREFSIDCCGVGVEPPLEISKKEIRFASTELGSLRTEYFCIKNNSLVEPRCFQIVPGDVAHGLKFNPSVGELAPGASTIIEIEFVAPKDKECLPKASEVHESIGQVRQSLGEEAWSFHASWNALCFVRGFLQPIDFLISTVLIEPQLEVDSKKLHFGAVAVGGFKILKLKIRNSGQRNEDLKACGLNPAGPFDFVNAVRSLDPGEEMELVIKFEPESNMVSKEMLTLCSKSANMEIILIGEGVSPCLKVLLEGDGEGKVHQELRLVDFGDIMIGAESLQRFKLRNCSRFAFDFEIAKVQSLEAPSNFSGVPVFSVEPLEGTIAPGEDIPITAKFTADRELLKMHEVFMEVEVQNQIGKHFLHLRGRCWSSPLYFHIPDGGKVCERDEIVNQFGPFGSWDFTVEASFDSSDDGAIKVVVGSCSSTQGGSFEFVDVPEVLNLSKTSGTIRAKDSEEIKITVEPGCLFCEKRITCMLKMDSRDRKVNLILKKNLDH